MAQRTAAGVAVQVKIAVVRHIADGGRVGGRPVADDQPALGQAVLDGQLKVAGKAVCPGGLVAVIVTLSVSPGVSATSNIV